MRTCRIDVSVVMAVMLLCACVSVARAQQNPLWIGYRLPDNPDLEAFARDVEAKARTERQAALVICEKSERRAECERQAEITFRGRLLTDRDIVFGLYTGRQQQNGSWSFTWLLNMARKDVLDPDFDQNFHHLAPGRISRLGIHVDAQNGCRFRRDADDTAISYNNRNLERITCELIQCGDTAEWLLWRLLDQTRHPDNSIVSFLLDHGVSAHLKSTAASGLLRALQRDHLEEARLLIEHGADVNAAVEDDFAPDVGTTPLMWAAAEGQTALVRLLLDHRADPNAERRVVHKSSLPRLADRLCEPCAGEIGLDRCSKPPAPRVLPWSTALASALANHHLDAATLLLDHGAVVDQTVRNVGTGGARQTWIAPALVLFSDDVEAVKLLLEHGADVSGHDGDGDTALLLACGVSDFARPGPEIVQLLLAHQADVNAKDKWGTTPLIAAAKHGRLDAVRLLLDAHADVNAVERNGMSALQYAVNGAYKGIVGLLRTHGAR